MGTCTRVSYIDFLLNIIYNDRLINVSKTTPASSRLLHFLRLAALSMACFSSSIRGSFTLLRAGLSSLVSVVVGASLVLVSVVAGDSLSVSGLGGGGLAGGWGLAGGLS